MTRRPLPRARVVAAATLALFLAIFALLVFQLRSGRDPALGAGGATLADAAAPRPAKRVVIRKTIVRRVVVHLPAEDDDADGEAPGEDEHDAPVAVVAPAAPAPATPAPGTAAPARAAAPLTTRSS